MTTKITSNNRTDTRADINPSIQGMLFTTPDAFLALIKESEKRPVGLRFGIPFDLTIPLTNPEYDETINWIKSFSNPILRRFAEQDFMFKPQIMKMLENKAKLKFIEFEKQWKTDIKNPLLYSGFTPLFCDIKYKEHYTDEEKENLERLQKFKSKGYEANLDAVSKDDREKLKQRWISEGFEC